MSGFLFSYPQVIFTISVLLINTFNKQHYELSSTQAQPSIMAVVRYRVEKNTHFADTLFMLHL